MQHLYEIELSLVIISTRREDYLKNEMLPSEYVTYDGNNLRTFLTFGFIYGVYETPNDPRAKDYQTCCTDICSPRERSVLYLSGRNRGTRECSCCKIITLYLIVTTINFRQRQKPYTHINFVLFITVFNMYIFCCVEILVVYSLRVYIHMYGKYTLLVCS